MITSHHGHALKEDHEEPRGIHVCRFRPQLFVVLHLSREHVDRGLVPVRSSPDHRANVSATMCKQVAAFADSAVTAVANVVRVPVRWGDGQMREN